MQKKTGNSSIDVAETIASYIDKCNMDDVMGEFLRPPDKRNRNSEL